MDCRKVGALIYKLRTEKNMTQKEIADKMNISDKTVSKWERGLGCPDVSLLAELSEVLGVNIEKILTGELTQNDIDGGNMNRTAFYVCNDCKNIITATGAAEISCCGRRLSPLEAKPADEKHRLEISEVEDELYITISHEMRKEHFISFVSYVCDNRCFTVRLYPEQNAEMRFPRMRDGKFYFYCSNDGLYVQKNN